MACVIALWLDTPFRELDARYGLTKAAELRMTANPGNDIVILVLRGIEHIDLASRAKLRELKYDIIDVSAIFDEVQRDYPEALEHRIWKGRKLFEMSFFRFLVVERFFGNSPVLTMDSDIVWRVDPYDLLDKWKGGGGSFLCYGSTCLVFIRGTSWYDSYREGFDRLIHDPSFGAEHSRSAFTGIYHEQALCQFLTEHQLMEDDQTNMLGHGISEKYIFSSNPLSFPKNIPRPMTFEKADTSERINGKQVPFWHMQTTFSGYLFRALLIPAMTGRTHFRVPYEPRSKVAPENLASELFSHLFARIVHGRPTFDGQWKDFESFALRERQYQAFFNGDLAKELFTDAKWWRPGIWAA